MRPANDEDSSFGLCRRFIENVARPAEPMTNGLYHEPARTVAGQKKPLAVRGRPRGACVEGEMPVGGDRHLR